MKYTRPSSRPAKGKILEMRAKLQNGCDKQKLAKIIADAAMAVVCSELAAIRLDEMQFIRTEYKRLSAAEFKKWLDDRIRGFRRVPKPIPGLREAYDKAHPRA